MAPATRGRRCLLHRRVGEQQSAAGANTPRPVCYPRLAVGEVEHRVNADDDVECLIIEGQNAIAIARLEPGETAKAKLFGSASRPFNRRLLRVYADQPALRPFDERQRRSARSACNVEDTAGLTLDNETGDSVLLVERPPSLLTEVLSIDHAPDFRGEGNSRSGGIARNRTPNSVLEGRQTDHS